MWSEFTRWQSQLRTPCYLYDLDKVRANARSFKEIAPPSVRVMYATMANPQPSIVNAVVSSGIGVFVNSVSHLKVALHAAVCPCDVLFAGSGHDEFCMSTVSGTGVCYCADSPGQLYAYLRHDPKGRIGLRVNVASLLGLSSADDPAPRLGMSVEQIGTCLSVDPSVSVLHVYVGTNLARADRYLACLHRLAELAEKFEQIAEIDLGGGFAVAPAESATGSLWRTIVDEWNSITTSLTREVVLRIEPGRSIVRTAGALFVSVTDVKSRGRERFVLVDSSVTWYPRRLVHGVEDHFVSLRGLPSDSASDIATICGCSTFSGDILARVPLPEVCVGDILMFANAGAYCESMHLDFLGIDRPASWAIDRGELIPTSTVGTPASGCSMSER